jgi:beta-lactamase class A
MMILRRLAGLAAGPLSAALALSIGLASPVQARDGAGIEVAFDQAFGTGTRAPKDFAPRFDSPLAQQIAMLAEGSKGRIGVAAIDLATGQEVAVLGDQRFPMASTSKIAIAATYLEGVDKGRWTLNSEWPLMVPVSSRPFSSAIAPVKAGQAMRAAQLIDLMITRSSNPATDALLAAVGGPAAVNDWARRAGIQEFELTRDIATLVRDDGERDPAVHIDLRDSASPRAMVQLLSGLHQGKWLTPASRAVIVQAMENCRTGTRRIPALLPGGVTVAHKTGSLNNTSSDIGIITMPDGRALAVAIYVTGQGTRSNREARIASIARGIFDGYAAQVQQPGTQQAAREWVNARY